MGNDTKTKVNDIQAAANALMHLKEAADALNNTFGNIKPRLPAGSSPGFDADSFSKNRLENLANPQFNSTEIPQQGSADNLFNNSNNNAFRGYNGTKTLLFQNAGSDANSFFGRSVNNFSQPGNDKLNLELVKGLSDKYYAGVRGSRGKLHNIKTINGDEQKPESGLYSFYRKANNIDGPAYHDKPLQSSGKGKGHNPGNLTFNQYQSGNNGIPKPGMPRFNAANRGSGTKRNFPASNNLFKESESVLKELISNLNDKVFQNHELSSPSLNSPVGGKPTSALFGSNAVKGFQGPKPGNLFTNSATASKGNDNKKVEIKLTGNGAGGKIANGNKQTGRNGKKQNATSNSFPLPAKRQDDLFHNSMKSPSHKTGGPMHSHNTGGSSQPVSSFNPGGMGHAHETGSNSGGMSGGVVFHVQNMSSHSNTHKHAIKSANEIHGHIVSVLTSAVADSKIGTDVH